MLHVHVHKGSAVNGFFDCGRFEKVSIPGYSLEFDPDEGAWPLSKRHMSNFTAHDGHHLTNRVKRELFSPQKSHGMLEGCIRQSELNWKGLLN